LLDAVLRVREQSASEIKEHVLNTIKAFTEQQASHDDLTLVVLKWRGNHNEQQVEVS
jgi:serine phosphatase RsbU (regulator of sigma subunit)